MEVIGKSHDARLHTVRKTIADEQIMIEKKIKEVEHLKSKLAENSESQIETLSFECTKACTKLKELQNKCHPGFLIAFDNIDFQLKRRDMTMSSQNSDIHWVNHVMVENRVSGNHLPCERPKADILDIPNISFLPNVGDQWQQKSNYVVLVSRIWVDYFDAFAVFKNVCVKHIPHKYSKEMSIKSNKVSIEKGRALLLKTTEYC